MLKSKNCKQCKNDFIGRGKYFCSRKCSNNEITRKGKHRRKMIGNKFRKGIKWTKEEREKQSKFPPRHLDKKHSEASKILMSKSAIGKHLDSNNGNFKHGFNKNHEYRSWVKNKRNRLKRAISKKLGGHSFGDWELLKKQYGYTCPCCKQIEPKIKLTEDHIIPLSKGGSDLIENIQPLCLLCNIRKHTNSTKY